MFTLQSYLPFDCTIRSAASFSRALSDHTDFEAEVFHPASPTSLGPQGKTDLVLCTTDSGELVVVDWSAGCNTIPASGIPAIKPGLRVVKTIRQARPGKDVCSLGRFIRVSHEFYPLPPLLWAAAPVRCGADHFCSCEWVVIGAWQDMFNLWHLETRPCARQHNQQVLFTDGSIEIVVTEVLSSLCLWLMVESNILC